MNSGHPETSHVTRLARALLIVERTLLPALGLVLLLSVLTPSPFAWAQTPDDEEGAVSLSTEQPQQGVPLTATLTDADGGVTGEMWQWSNSDTATGTSTDISGATSAAYTPAETDLDKYLKATVSYDDNHGSGKSASATTANAVGVVAVTVTFGESAYSAAEGGLASVSVDLSAEPKRPVTIPITISYQGTATADDHATIAETVSFGAASQSRSVSISISDDATADHGEGIVLGFGTPLPDGVTLGATTTATVTIIDDDPAVTVTFDQSTYSVEESGTVSIGLTLSEDPRRPLNIPITATGLNDAGTADYEDPDEVTFGSGDTTATLIFTPTDDDVDDDGERVRLGFGSLPPGVSNGATTTATVSIKDDDDPRVKVQFSAANYNVSEGSSVTVTVTIDNDPERTVVIPLSATYEGGTTSTDFPGIPASVTFNSGQTSKTFSVSTNDDFIDNDAKKAKITFGASLPDRVTEDSIDETTVTIVDNETRAVEVFPTSGSVGENATSTYTVNLTSEPTSDVTVTIATASDQASAEPASLTFNAGDYGIPQTVTLTSTDDDEDEPSETATFTHSASGGDYGSNTVSIDDFVLTITDDDETPVISGSAAVTFAEIEYDADAADADLEIATYSARDGDGDDITWSLGGTDSSFFEFKEESDGDLVLSFNGRAFTGEGPDFESPVDGGSNNTYVVTVNASDGTNTGMRTVTVTITNVDETPSVLPFLFFNPVAFPGKELNEPPYHVVPTPVRQLHAVSFLGQDQEGQSLTWSLGGVDGGKFRFEISSNPNQLNVFFRNPPDFENPTDSGGDNVYDFTARAYDGTNTGQWAFFVGILGINEPPDIREDTVPDYKELEWDFTGTRPPIHTFSAIDYDAGDTSDTLSWNAGTVIVAPGVESMDGEHVNFVPTEGIVCPQCKRTSVLFFPQTAHLPQEGPYPDFENPQDFNSDNVFDFVVIAEDQHGATSKYRVQVRVTNVDEKPQFTRISTTNRTYDENLLDVVADYDARDEEGSPITWSLTGPDRGDFAISKDGIVTFRGNYSVTSGGLVTFLATPSFEDPLDADGDNVYAFTVVASDGRRTNSVDVTFTVADLEEDGVITVDNLNPAVDDTVRFELSDPDGGIQVGATDGFSWTVQGRATSTDPWQDITSSNNGELFFVYTAQEEDTGKQLRAVVASYTDRRGPGKTAESEPTIAVTADPIANAPPRLRSPAEYVITEGPGGRIVGSPVHVTDRESDPLTFAIVPGDDADLFEVNVSTGQLSLDGEADFETATAGVLNLRVTVSDGKGVDNSNNEIDDATVDLTIDVTVTVTDLEELGVVTLSAKEPATGVELLATLADGDGNVSGESWQWERSSDGRTNWFNITGAESSAYTPTSDDENFYLRVTVEYTDNRGAGKRAGAVATASVPSRNRRPVFPLTETGERTVMENTRINGNIGDPVVAVDPERDRLSYTLTGTDARNFTITNTGQLRVKEPLDFETKETYSLTVNVHDGLDGAGLPSLVVDDTRDVTITVENVEELGTVALTTPTQFIRVTVAVTAELSDDDVASGVTWQWSHSPNGRTDWANIANADTYTYTPSDELEGRFIRATASYTDGHGPNKVARGVSPRPVAEPPPVNSPPAFPVTETGIREVPEDATEGADVGVPVAATDLNEGDSSVNAPLVYSLSGTDAASFTIDANIGQLQVAPGVTLDYEGKRSYRVTVEVTDGHDELGDDEDPDVIDARINVTINVTDVNEAPVVTGATSTSVLENTGRAVATYTGTDPERDALTWSVNRPDFWVSDRGQLHFAAPPSFEDGTTYSVTVTATDDDATAPLSGSFDMTVTVTDVEEEGVVTIAPPRGWVDAQTPFTATLADDDGSVSDEIWRWARSTNRSTWTDIPGATTETYFAAAGDEDHYLRATVQYTDRRGSGKEAEAVLTKSIGAARPAANAAPAFAEATANRNIGEGTAPGRAVGERLRATDADAEDVLVYTLSGLDPVHFDIDAATGQLKTKAVLNHDPQGQNTFTVTVNVHDGFDGSYNPSDSVDDSVEVTIIVTRGAPPSPLPFTPPPPTSTPAATPTPPATPPSFAEGDRTSRSVPTDALAGDAVGSPVVAQHPSNLTITYSLGGADAGRFTVDETTGQIRIGPGATLEEGYTYTVTLTASVAGGAGGSTVSVDIEVSVKVLEPEFNRYDLNRDGALEKAEALKAVSDYFALLIEKEEVLEVVSLYFARRETETNQ